MTVGIVCSSGGSVLLSALRIFTKNIRRELEVFVVTDRACAAEERCHSEGVPVTRIPWRSNEQFSSEAREHFLGCHAELVVLFYTRLVTAELINRIATFNIHPSFLPAFRGFNALSSARKNGSCYVAATLHVATENVDGGTILAQSAWPIPPNAMRTQWDGFSFLQKTTLFLLLLDYYSLGRVAIHENDCFPSLTKAALGNAYVSPGFASDAMERAHAEFLESEIQERFGCPRWW